jgi:hypothetical protein
MLTCSVDLSSFRTAVGRTLDHLQRDIESSVRAAAYAGERQAKAGDFKDKSGELRRKIQARQVRGGHLSSTWMFVAETSYARFVEEGTKPHDIWPKAAFGASKSSLKPGQTRRGRGKGPHESVVGRGRALRWKDEGGGEHFAGMVHHPGTKPVSFMGRAYWKAESVLMRDLNLSVQNLSDIWR